MWVSQRTLRVVTAVVAALVALLNGLFGWHLTNADVLAVVLPLIGLVLAEAHVEAHPKVQDIRDIVKAVLVLLNETRKGDAAGNGAKTGQDGQKQAQ
jgi:uncharacterized protein (DUF697 family)